MIVPPSVVSDVATATGSFMAQISPAMVLYIGAAAAFYAARQLKRLFPR